MLKYIPAIDRMIVLVDGIVYVLDTTSYEISNNHEKLKNAHTFCINELRDRANLFSQQVCL